MQTIISPFISLLASIWLINLGGGLQSTLLGMRANSESFDVTSTGMVMSSYFVGYIVSFFIIPQFINSVGHIRSFAAFASLSSAATLCHAVFVDPVSWIFLRAITGLCFGGLVLVGESWLNVSTGNENRGAVFSIYMLVIFSAAALSQTLVTLTPVAGYDLFVLVSIALSLSVLPLTLGKKIRVPDIQESTRMAFSKLVKKFPLGSTGVFVSGVLSSSLWTMMAVYAIQRGLDTSGVANVMFFMLVGGSLSLLPVGKLSDIFDRRKIIFGLSLACFGCCLLFAFPGFLTPEALPFFAALLGFFTFPQYAIATSHINDYLEADEFVPACGSMVLLYGAGALVAPMGVAKSMDIFGPNGMFIFLSIIQVPLFCFAAVRIMSRDVLPVEERSDFVYDIPKATPSVSPLDPRNIEAEELSEEIIQDEILQEEILQEEILQEEIRREEIQQEEDNENKKTVI